MGEEPAAYCTIDDVKPHRISLTDEDIDLIIAALTARAAMAKGARLHRIQRLAARLAEGKPGNPKWILDEAGQAHEAVPAE
jgi:hypothetical protein